MVSIVTRADARWGEQFDMKPTVSENALGHRGEASGAPRPRDYLGVDAVSTGDVWAIDCVTLAAGTGACQPCSALPYSTQSGMVAPYLDEIVFRDVAQDRAIAAVVDTARDGVDLDH